MKNLIKLLLPAILLGCELPCAEISRVSDLGPLPEEVLGIMPYEDGETVSFLYAGDTTVHMEVAREMTKQYEYYQDECSKITTVYRIDMTEMATADSAFAILAWVTNLAVPDWYQVVVNDSYFHIPVSPHAYEEADILDSLTVNGVVYYNVCRSPRVGIEPEDSTAPVADSLFFNTGYGFLEIVMADGSRYQRQE